jgi:AraC-like DNA-binding protein
MNYQTYTPIDELQPFIKCFWSLDDLPGEGMKRQRVIPDGCMEMIFHYGDLYRQYFEDGSFITQPRCFLFGQITTSLEIEPTGKSGVFAARFLPEGLAPFLSIPVYELQNTAVSLIELFGKEGQRLETQVLSASENLQRIKIIEDFLLARMVNPKTVDDIIKQCVDVIIKSGGRLRMNEVTNQVNINRRNMERKFMSAIGISPKQLAKLVRLQATIKMLGQKNFTSLTSLAYENGYYDQAHFIKDFKEFTGISPKLFFASNLQLSSLFVTAE